MVRGKVWIERIRDFAWSGNNGPDAKESATAPRAVRAAAAFAASISFRNIAKWYGDHHALKDISLDVAAGEVVCLLGPSGCGKTTLLRLASGIDRPSAGEVVLNNRVVAGPGVFVPPEKRSVGLMFQDFALFPHLTVLQNVAFGLQGLEQDIALREAAYALVRTSDWTTTQTPTPTSCPVASSSASHLHEPSFPARPSFSWMNRSRAWTCNCGSRSGAKRSRCFVRPDRRACSLPTIRTRQWHWGTGSRLCATASLRRQAMPRLSIVSRQIFLLPGCSRRSTRSTVSFAPEPRKHRLDAFPQRALLMAIM